jgi:PPP family 3-phenylpropionic acid transporter
MPPALSSAETQGRGIATRLALVHALTFLGVGFYLPFFPLWLAAKGLSDAQIGLVLSIPIVTRIVAAPVIAGLGDRRVKAVHLLAGLNLIAGLLYLALIPAEGALWIGLTLWLNAIALCGVIPLADALTTAQVRAGARLDYGRVRLWGSVSFLGANLLGGYLVAGQGVTIVPLALAASAGLAALAALSAPDIPARQATVDDDADAGGRFPAAFWFAVAAAACINATHAAVYGFGSLHWRGLGFGDTVIGALWAVGVVAEIGLFLFCGGIVARGVAGLAWIAAGAGAAIVRFSLMALDPGLPATILLQILHGASFGCTHLGILAVVSALAPYGRRAAAQGRLVAAGALASALMTAVAGYLYQRHGALAFLGMTPLALLGLLCLALAKRHWPGDTG